MKKKSVSMMLTVSMLAAAIAFSGCTAETGANGANDNVGVVPTVDPEVEATLVAETIEANYDGIAAQYNGEKVAVHDPSIKVFNGKYYIYGSHMTSASSDTLGNWAYIGNGYNAKNPTYGQIFSNTEAYKYSGLNTSVIPTDDGLNHVWAPDVVYNKKMGKYCMYACMSSNWYSSNLFLATSDTPEGPFEFQQAFIYSGLTAKTVQYTDVYNYVTEEYAASHYWKTIEYNYKEYPNAIDPSVFYDANGKMWMVYGSWSGGIFILEIDEATGLPIHPETDEANNVDAYFGKKLLGGGHKSIEGPFIHYDAAAGYYYLYVSYGSLTQKGGYQVRVYRSENPDGPYVDMNGKTPFNCSHINYGLKLSGNYFLPGLKTAYMATGHNSAFTDTDGRNYICFHSRFESSGEAHQPVVKQILTNEEGWPCLAPYKTSGETLTEGGEQLSDVVGSYYYINQGTTVSSVIAQPVMINLNADGTITGSFVGHFTITKGTNYIHLFIKKGEKTVEYSGVLIKQYDNAGNYAMTFSAVGSNESVWGVKYLELKQ